MKPFDNKKNVIMCPQDMDVPLPVKVNTSEIKLGLAFMVPHLVYKLQVICLRGT